MTNMTNQRHEELTVDVLVLGSGAAGLSAALYSAKKGLTVLVCEKSSHLGGTTALSNGMIWIPSSKQAQTAGIKDSIVNAETYLKGELAEFYQADFIDALLKDGPTAISELEDDTQVKFTLASAPDYHSSRVGGVDKGRALSPAHYDGRLLTKNDFNLIANPIRVLLGGMMISSSEINKFLNPFKSWDAFQHVMGRIGRYAFDRLEYRRGTELSGGNALIARFLISLRKLNVEIWSQAPLSEICIENGRAVGGLIDRQGTTIRVKARHGVILATGGFARNAALRVEISGPHQHSQTLVHEDVKGEAIQLARHLGASLDTEVASPGFWTPVSLLPTKSSEAQIVPYGWLDRGRPGVIAIGPNGRRFVNESNSYHDVCIGLFENGYPKDDRFYFICDYEFVKKRGMGQILPWPWTLSISGYERTGYIQVARSIKDLALKIGIDPDALETTVDNHNENVISGVDSEFGRGESAFNHALGDVSVGTKNPNLGPIRRGPFIALKIVPATLGTASGLKTDTESRVTRADGSPIQGLFACGNDMTSPMRGKYPGAGITIGPGIVFAYRAVEAILQESDHHEKRT